MFDCQVELQKNSVFTGFTKI